MDSIYDGFYKIKRRRDKQIEERTERRITVKFKSKIEHKKKKRSEQRFNEK